MTRAICLDIHKAFAQVGILDTRTGEVRQARFASHPDSIRGFAATLGKGDQVALESCTNAFAFHRLLCQHAGRVVVSNPLKTRVIAEAKVKTDKVDAEILARLLAADFLPEVWVPDERTEQLRHLVFHRHGLVQQRTQTKNRIHAILHRNLIAAEFTDLFGKAGRRFLAEVELAGCERELLDVDLQVLDFLGAQVEAADRRLAQATHEDPEVCRLMTIPGISLTSAVALKAAIGDVGRFKTSGHLVSYFGLNPSVHQSGEKAYTGSISRRGRSHARSVCVEAAQQLVKTPGPLHAFFVRLERRKPRNVAITAVARKLVVLVWHMLTEEEDYRYSPPARTREKLLRARHLATGEKARRGEIPGPVPDRTRDKEPGCLGEKAYQAFLQDRYGPRGPQGTETKRSPMEERTQRHPPATTRSKRSRRG